MNNYQYDPYNYQPQQMPRQPMPMYGTQQLQYPQYNQQPPVLFGKYVDGIDVVRATEVPTNIGSGIFPTPDFSTVFVKSWNNDGTTSIYTYKRETQDCADTSENKLMSEIMARLDSIEAKITSTTTTKGKKASNE